MVGPGWISGKPEFEPDGITCQFPPHDAVALRRVCEEQLPVVSPVVCELGCWTGRSTSIIAGVVYPRGGTLFSVDWFRGSMGAGTDIDAVDVPILQVFANNMMVQGFPPNVMVMHNDTAAGFIKDGVLDMVFIDSDHRYSAVCKDIQCWVRKVKPGGIIAGHDFEFTLTELQNNGFGDIDLRTFGEMEYSKPAGMRVGLHTGVIRAVTDYWPEDRIHKEWETSIWWVRV